MRHPLVIAAACTAMAHLWSASGPAAAQEGQGLAPSRAEAEPGSPYAVGTFEDWTVRCIRGEDPATDPCQMTQRLLADDGSPTAEVSVFPVPDNAQAVAAATMVTPLETLLTQGISVSIDGGQPAEYPFQFCNRQGCVAQVGFQQSDIDLFKAGTTAVVRIFPVAAPTTPVDLQLSLSGFTAAYDSLAPLPGLQ